MNVSKINAATCLLGSDLSVFEKRNLVLDFMSTFKTTKGGSREKATLRFEQQFSLLLDTFVEEVGSFIIIGTVTIESIEGWPCYPCASYTSSSSLL